MKVTKTIKRSSPTMLLFSKANVSKAGFLTVDSLNDFEIWPKGSALCAMGAAWGTNNRQTPLESFEVSGTLENWQEHIYEVID